MRSENNYSSLSSVCAFLVGFIVGILYTAFLLYLAVYGHAIPPYYYSNAKLKTYYKRNFTCTLEYYKELLAELNKERYIVLRVIDFIRLYRKGKLPLQHKVIVILRHDVDWNIKKAREMSNLEAAYNVTSTYYIRVRGPYNVLSKDVYSWLKWLNKNGFEVGLHYETLYFSGYNFTEAETLFLEDIELLRHIVPVYTVCSHGNIPHPKYINYEIFVRNPDLYRLAKIEGEAYLTIGEIVKSLRPQCYKYLSDTYRRDINWIGILRSAKPGCIIYILIHPDNWIP